MTTSIRSYAVAVLALVAVAASSAPARAGVVGSGNPASCNEAELASELAGTDGTITSAKRIRPTSGLGSSDVTIDGTGQQITLQGNGSTRLFYTEWEETAFAITFKNLTLKNGVASQFGGAIYLAYQDPSRLTTLNADHVTFLNNTASQAGPDFGGGAIYAKGGIVNVSHCVFTGNSGGNGGAIGNLQARFTIEDSVFSGNRTHASSGSYGHGGAIYIDGSNSGTLTIRRTRFTGNVASKLGGAIHTWMYQLPSGMTIEDSVFDANSAGSNGGAIFHMNGRLDIARSAFHDNTAHDQGGGLWVLKDGGHPSDTPVTITNATFYRNTANGCVDNGESCSYGGGIANSGATSLALSHVTIVGNHAGWVGGGIMSGASGVTVRASIIANNTSSNPWSISQNCTDTLPNPSNFSFEWPAPLTHNYNDLPCFSAPAVDPKLGAFAGAGTSSASLAPTPASPAIGRETSGCPPPTTDQRGFARSAPCDVGSVEGVGLTIGDVSVAEGTGAGTTIATFTITNTPVSTSPVTVHWATAEGTAKAGTDYTTASGTATIAANTASTTVNVSIVRDALDEPDETFTVNLSSPVGATIVDGVAVGTIVDDDPASTISVSDCSVTEGTGGSTPCVFTVSLSAVSGRLVLVPYATANVTASAGSDYTAASGTLQIPAGSPSATVPVSVSGDSVDEPTETFRLNLGTPTNATPGDMQGTGTIIDDDVTLVDLAITKTDGAPSVIAGQSTVYTIAVTNAGPGNATGATVTDAFPAAITSVSWTCSAVGGASCGTASGSGNISQTVNVPVGGTVTFVATASVSAAATGTLSNMAIVAPSSDPANGGYTDPNPGNNAASDTDTILIPADIQVTKTDGRATAAPGDAISYTIVVANAGPNAVNGVSVVDTMPASLLPPTSWTCLAAGGAACNGASGTGDLSQSVNLPVGGSVTYTVTGTLSADPTSLVNTVTASLPATHGDPTPANASATDADLLVCGNERRLVADGRELLIDLASSATQWLLVPTEPGRSYSLEVRRLTDSGVSPAWTLFGGDEGCHATITAVSTDTTAIDPGVANGKRLSFTAGGSDPHYRLRLANGAGAARYSASLAETTVFSPAWSTNGTYNTYYSIQNTTSVAITAKLLLTTATGTAAGETTLAIPAGATISTNTSALAIARTSTGTALLTHDGPPGAVVAEAAIANFGFTPAYVQPVRFRTVRESR